MCLATGNNTRNLDADLQTPAAQFNAIQAQGRGPVDRQAAAAPLLNEQQRRDELRAQNEAIARQRQEEMARVAEQQRQAQAQQQALVQAQARQQQVAQQQAAQQQQQQQQQREAQAAQIAQQQRAQQEEIARQRAEQERQVTAQRLAAGAASTSQRVLSQRPVGRGPTAPITADEADVVGRRRRAAAGGENLRIGSSGQAPGAGLNIGA